jgi:hypothetical protein
MYIIFTIFTLYMSGSIHLFGENDKMKMYRTNGIPDRMGTRRRNTYEVNNFPEYYRNSGEYYVNN